MICKRCGALIEEQDARFCSICGAPVEQSTLHEPVAETMQDNKQMVDSQPTAVVEQQVIYEPIEASTTETVKQDITVQGQSDIIEPQPSMEASQNPYMTYNDQYTVNKPTIKWGICAPTAVLTILFSLISILGCVLILHGFSKVSFENLITSEKNWFLLSILTIVGGILVAINSLCDSRVVGIMKGILFIAITIFNVLVYEEALVLFIKYKKFDNPYFISYMLFFVVLFVDMLVGIFKLHILRFFVLLLSIANIVFFSMYMIDMLKYKTLLLAEFYPIQMIYIGLLAAIGFSNLKSKKVQQY